MGGSSPSSGGDKGQQLVHAVAGGVAGAVSRLVVGPLDVVKIRMQVQLEPIRQAANSKYHGVVQALRTIVREEGIQVRSAISFARHKDSERHIQHGDCQYKCCSSCNHKYCCSRSKADRHGVLPQPRALLQLGVVL
jgi:hypothetical protein